MKAHGINGKIMVAKNGKPATIGKVVNGKITLNKR